MNRDKVLELAREAELVRQIAIEVPFVVDRLERFAALIEREVRGDAEPIAFIGTDGNLGWLKKPEVIYSKAVPLFMQPAPDVDAKPVYAFRRKGVSKDFCTCSKERYLELSDKPNLFEVKKFYEQD